MAACRRLTLCASSCLFLVPTRIAFAGGHYVLGAALCVLVFTSVVNHGLSVLTQADRAYAAVLTTLLTWSAASRAERHPAFAGATTAGLAAGPLYALARHSLAAHVALHAVGAAGFALYAAALG